jgi:hypothetical protein
MALGVGVDGCGLQLEGVFQQALDDVDHLPHTARGSAQVRKFLHGVARELAHGAMSFQESRAGSRTVHGDWSASLRRSVFEHRWSETVAERAAGAFLSFIRASQHPVDRATRSSEWRSGDGIAGDTRSSTVAASDEVGNRLQDLQAGLSCVWRSSSTSTDEIERTGVS